MRELLELLELLDLLERVLMERTEYTSTNVRGKKLRWKQVSKDIIELHRGCRKQESDLRIWLNKIDAFAHLEE